MLCSCILTLLCALDARASNSIARITGRTISAAGVVAGAEVVIQSTGEAERSFRTTSDSAGVFAFANVTSGVWHLTARRVGYEPATLELTLSDEVRDTNVVVHLKAIAQPLDPVAVVDEGVVPARYGSSSRLHEFYLRRSRGVGRFFTREDLEELTSGRVAGILRKVPGARVRVELNGDVSVNFARCSASQLRRSGSLESIAFGRGGDSSATTALFLDGMRISSQQAGETLGSLRLSEIEAIEVYRGPTELPSVAMGNACAAIFIWSRFGADTTQRR